MPSRGGSFLPLFYSTVMSRGASFLPFFYSAVPTKKGSFLPLLHLAMPSRRRELTFSLLFCAFGHLVCFLEWRAHETFFPSLTFGRGEWGNKTPCFACGTKRKRHGKYTRITHTIKSKGTKLGRLIQKKSYIEENGFNI